MQTHSTTQLSLHCLVRSAVETMTISSPDKSTLTGVSCDTWAVTVHWLVKVWEQCVTICVSVNACLRRGAVLLTSAQTEFKCTFTWTLKLFGSVNTEKGFVLLLVHCLHVNLCSGSFKTLINTTCTLLHLMVCHVIGSNSAQVSSLCTFCAVVLQFNNDWNFKKSYKEK